MSLFFMVLHDCFAQIRSQLLLMDPLPPINKVFSLISQEEQQRKIGVHANSNSNSADTMAFAVKNENLKRFTEKLGSSNSGGYRGNQNSSNCYSRSYKG